MSQALLCVSLGRIACRPGDLSGNVRRAARIRAAALSRLESLRVVLEDICDPGNRAAILRSVESLGLLNVHEVITPGGVTEVCKPKATSRGRSIVNGAEKWLDLHQHSAVQECIATLQAQGFVVLAAVPPGGGAAAAAGGYTRCVEPLALEDLEFSRPAALLFGSEARGVSPAALEAADGTFTIPLPGLSESLNVSVAVAVCCHFARHGRRQHLGLAPGQGDQSAAAAEALAASYVSRGLDRRFAASLRCGRSREAKRMGSTKVDAKSPD
ncbi:unnamed protein product [Polarella glacialis]|uniref:tRNA/rRNA methyltransferase SpoU type domain-containing protein n=1 Tax=Polarella glacialis TaxID=89957 RepID=A0A813F8F6_POLGL|nr:unnamed protein product [Polarella glacialis]CAE8641718.1 unnamed protein product [Polarella glacialis]CAE8647013.1 unnamed protein product [Polarella glacialis]CAE8649173.1 unnamed protein product [Polarella glacialis]